MAPAAPPSAKSQEERDRANTLMDEGDAHVEKGNLEAALAAYKAAHAIMGVPTTGIEIARTLERLRRLREALVAAKAIAEIPVAPAESRPFADARENAAALAVALETRIPTLTITVKIAAVDTQITVTLDGKPLSSAELRGPIALEPGTYRIAASALDHTPATVEVTLKERDRGQAALALAKVVTITAPPATKPPPPPPPPALSPLVPVGFSVAGVGLIVGAITGALAISNANNANNLCPGGACGSAGARDQAAQSYASADGLAVGSDIAFILALGGAAVGIYGVVVSVGASPQSPAAPPKPVARFVLGPMGGAIQASF